MAKLLFYASCTFLLLVVLPGCQEDKPPAWVEETGSRPLLDTMLTSNRLPSYNNSANYPTTTGMASYYADRFQGKRTASGEPYDTAAFTAAHRTLPFGTMVLVTHISTGDSAVVRINDRGPHSQKRIIDLSKAAAKALRMYTKGIARVSVQALPDSVDQTHN